MVKLGCDFSESFLVGGSWSDAAIAACKQQLAAAGVTECNNNENGQSDCSEQTSAEGTPVLEEFIPMNRPSVFEDDEDDEQQLHKQMKIDRDSNSNEEKSSSADSKKKSDWLKCAQLWNQTPDPPTKEVSHCSILAAVSWKTIYLSSEVIFLE